jgi:hypothetical protein
MDNKVTFLDCLKKMAYPYSLLILFGAIVRIIHNFLSIHLDYTYLPSRLIILLFKPGMNIDMEWPVVWFGVSFIFFASLEYLGEKLKKY